MKKKTRKKGKVASGNRFDPPLRTIPIRSLFDTMACKNELEECRDISTLKTYVIVWLVLLLVLYSLSGGE